MNRLLNQFFTRIRYLLMGLFGEVEEVEQRVDHLSEQFQEFRKESQDFQQQILALVQQVLDKLTPPVAVTIAFTFSSQPKGASNMPLSMPVNTKNEKFFIIGADADGVTGAQLAPGQTITVVADDPNTVAITMDSAPGVDNEGVQSVASGSVAAGPAPALGTPVNVSATVLNADGSTAESVSDTVTITAAVPGVAVSIGELFEVPVSGVSGATKK